MSCGRLPYFQAGNLRVQGSTPGCQKYGKKYSQPYSEPLMVDFARSTLKDLKKPGIGNL